MIEISSEILDRCYAYGLEAYPEEACGFISGGIEIVSHLGNIHPMKNLMNHFHTQDPQMYPRTNKNAYMIDPREQMRLERALKKEKQKFKVIYHSHPDVGAYFSEKDKSDALWDGDLRMPGVDYLICGIKKNQRDGAILASFNTETKDFDIIRLD